MGLCWDKQDTALSIIYDNPIFFGQNVFSKVLKIKVCTLPWKWQLTFSDIVIKSILKSKPR